jgi:hypothetical protein
VHEETVLGRIALVGLIVVSGCYFWRRNAIVRTSGLRTNGGISTKVDVALWCVSRVQFVNDLKH